MHAFTGNVKEQKAEIQKKGTPKQKKNRINRHTQQLIDEISEDIGENRRVFLSCFVLFQLINPIENHPVCQFLFSSMFQCTENEM